MTITRIGVPTEIHRVSFTHSAIWTPAVLAPLVRAMREAAARLVAEHRGLT